MAKKIKIGINDFASWCKLNDRDDLLSEWDYEKNKSPNLFSYSSIEKVWWKCSKGHEFEATIGNRTIHNTKCPYCANRKLIIGFNDLRTLHPDLAKEFDEQKNGIKASELLVSGNRKYWWLCKNGHSYESGLDNRISRKHGCPFCSGHQVLLGFNDLSTTHPLIANEWDFQKNVLKPSEISKGSLYKAWWICPNGHSYQAQVNQRDNKNNCPYCNHIKVLSGFNDLATTNLELAKEWHPTKNGNLKPTDVFGSSGKKVWWLCSHGHEWLQSPHLRSKGKGCPICSNEVHVSFPEKVFYFYLKKVFPDTLQNYNPGWKNQRNIDIYIPSLRLGIEYDGDRWHKNVDKDLIKNGLCLTHNIKLIRIREPKCPIITNSSSIDYLFDKENYQNAINFILDFIKDNYSIFYEITVNLNEDRTLINELVLTSEKLQSICETHPNIVKEWNYSKNGLLKPEFLTFGSTKKVWWKCEKCGYEWLASVNGRCRLGRGCPNCNTSLFIKGENDIETSRPDLLSYWDFQKNVAKPSEIFIQTRKKYWWHCEKGHSFQKSPNEMNIKTECPFCSNKKVLRGFNDLTVVYPNCANEWDYTKNTRGPDEYIFNSCKKAWWKCLNGHSYQQQIAYHIKSKKCPICSGKQIFEGVNDLSTMYPEVAIDFDIKKNKPMLPNKIGSKITNKVWWKCHKCGFEWQARVNWVTDGHGCPNCSNKNKNK